MNAPPTPQETQALTTAEEAANLPLPGRSAALSALGAAALAACGGGSDDSPSTPGTPGNPGSPGDPGDGPGDNPGTPATPLTHEESARFLAQATLGASRADIETLTSKGLATWLNEQFAMPVSMRMVDWLYAKGLDAEEFRFSQRGLDNALWRTLITSPDALRQRVALALSEICVASVLGVDSSYRQFALAYYYDILQTHAFGNYRQLLEDISLSPAMGYYLTYRGNAKANPKTGSQPDENYARELMQLFTIGLVQLQPDGSTQTANGQPVETYKQADVSGLARVFTGWDLDTSGYANPYPPEVMRRPMVQVGNRYESGAKSFLGSTIAAGTGALDALNGALDTLFAHPNLPVFIARQMIQRLVTSNPSPAYVARVAAAFANNGQGVRGDMQALWRAILLDPEARDPQAAANPTFGKLREPMVRLLNWARACQVTSVSDAWAVGDLSDPGTRLGQSPLRSPSVFNFFRPGYVPPNTALAAQGLAGPEFQITTEVSIAGYVNFMQQAIANAASGDLRADYSSLLALAGDSAALLAELNLVLAAGALSAPTLAQIQGAVDSLPFAATDGARNRTFMALLLVMAAPEYIVQK
ncbi:MAG: DUF1800 domain-containing protein [Comamonadaceae bacterium]|nr:DUF1800 domain-containing protein [Comamonadaceae bacterium]